jgi:tRNA dimethylallyltransferase
MMRDSQKNSALLIAGPTASGKSALAIAEAQARGGIIINADSMQVYRELQIISARPSMADEAMAPHRLYGHVSGAEAYSAAQWLADAKREMEAAWEQGAVPIVVGGTGLYFMSLINGLATLSAIAPDIREKWRAFHGDVHAELAKRDADGAAKLNPNDRQRIVRALEVVESTGKPLRVWQAEASQSAFLNDINAEKWFLDVPREVLYARAEQRFDQMMEQGALDEVQRLPKLATDLPMMRAIGVPELLSHLRGEISEGDAITLAKTATRQYIKRQLTWWRGQMKDWTPVSPGERP